MKKCIIGVIIFCFVFSGNFLLAKDIKLNKSPDDTLITDLVIDLLYSPYAIKTNFNKDLPSWVRPKVDYPMIVDNQLGVYAGGIGISFNRGPDGVVDLWNISGKHIGDDNFHINGSYRGNNLPVLQFSIFQKVGQNSIALALGKKPQDDSLKSWQWYDQDKGEYFGSFPFALWRYQSESLKCPIKLLQYSPFIPNNDISATPCVLYFFVVNNPYNVNAQVSFMLTAPNMIGWEIEPVAKNNPYDRRYKFNKINKNNCNRFFHKDKIIGVVCDNKNIKQTPPLAGQMAIATIRDKDVVISHKINFDPQADGQEIWQEFSKDGTLKDDKNYFITKNGKGTAAGLCVKVNLGPKKSKVIPFAIAFDWPFSVVGENIIPNKYTAKYSQSGRNAFAIASDALNNYPLWIKDTLAWQESIFKLDIPTQLKTAAVNEAYFLLASGPIWNKDNDLLALLEGIDFANYETIDVSLFSWLKPKLFPKQDSNTLAYIASLIPYQDNREIAYQNPAYPQHKLALGKGLGFNPGNYSNWWPAPRKVKGAVLHDIGCELNNSQEKLNNPQEKIEVTFKWQNTNYWKDLPATFIIQFYRAYKLNGQDKAYLSKNWPYLVELLDFLQSLDTDNDGLPNHGGYPDQTFDTWRMLGNSSYTGGLTQVAYQIAAIIASKLDKKEEALAYKKKAKLARRSLDKLWNGKYYNIFDGQVPQDMAQILTPEYREKLEARAQDIMAGQILGQLYAKLLELEPVFPSKKVSQTLETIYQNNFKQFRNATIGVVNGLTKTGQPIGSEQADEVWIGVNQALVALMVLEGRSKEAKEIFSALYNCTWQGGYQWRIPEALDADRQFRASTYMRAGSVLAIVEAYNILAKKRDQTTKAK